jgi:hypothetical protein
MPVVGSGLYDVNGRKYIDIDNKKLKVPWRFNRAFVNVKGLVTVHELKPGDVLKNFEYETKTWNGETFYVLKSIET